MARTDQPHKLTLETWIARCTDFSDHRNEKHRNLDYRRPETAAAWNGSRVKVPIWCNVHERFFVQQPANHMNGQGCPDCGAKAKADKRRKTNWLEAFRAKHGDVYDYSRVEYVNSHTPVEIVCRTHGSFLQKPLNHQAGEGCPRCWEDRRKALGKTRNDDFKETFAERAAQVHRGRYAILKTPEGAHDTALLLCSKHGEFEQKAYSHLAGHGCYRCGAKGTHTHTQRDVACFVEGLGVRIEHDNRTILGGMHIDVWAPDAGIGIEYNGSYWHTHERVGNKHREKWERAERAGVRLLQIFDFEWLERRTAVEERLRAIFGASDKTAARSCLLRPVTCAEQRDFFDEVHTQGAGKHPLYAYGLFDGARMVACMTFGKPRFGNSAWELMRFASRGRVQGGFSRLLRAFIREHGPDRIGSFCDLRWGNGEVYAQNGFVLDHTTSPDIWYTDGSRKVAREALQNPPSGLTQQQWAREQGLSLVKGVGHRYWLWTKTA